MEKKLNRRWVAAAIGLGLMQGLFGGLTGAQTAERRLASINETEDPHVVAVVRTAEGSHVEGDLCHYEQKVQRMQIYADGRVVELSTVRTMSCKKGERIEKSQSGRPVVSRIPAEKVDEVLTKIRKTAGDAEGRLAQLPRSLASSEDEIAPEESRAIAEMNHLVSWSVSRDWTGSLNPLDLPQIVEPTAEGLGIGRGIQDEIRASFVK